MRLFVYGQLKTAEAGGGDPPRTARDIEPAWMHGILYKADGDAFLTNIGDDSQSPIRGQVMSIAPEELRELDELEEPEWERIRARTSAGESVWVYEYQKTNLPVTAERIHNFLAPRREVQELVRDRKHGGPEK